VIAAAIATSGCSKGTRLDWPNFVLITLDTARADHLGCYGYFRDTSPAIDALAAESAVFERCIVPMATTLPSHVSILTSTYPIEHGILANLSSGNRRFQSTGQLQSFAEACKDAGYRTAAFVSAAPVKRATGIAAGFETFNEPEEIRRGADETTDSVLAWIDTLSASPFFIWVHYFDPHRLYLAPEPFRSMYLFDEALERHMRERGIPDSLVISLSEPVEDVRASINSYDGEIRFMDHALGRLLDRLRSRPDWNETVVLLIGDHGEGLGQHEWLAHGTTWEEQVRTPMMIRAPGLDARRIAELVSSVDALPTLLGLVESDAFAGFRQQASGRDVLARGWRPRAVLSQESGRRFLGLERRKALTSNGWKYVRVERRIGEFHEELYDLRSDPHELGSVHENHPEIVRALADSIERILSLQEKRASLLQGSAETVEEFADSGLIEELRSLGYVED